MGMDLSGEGGKLYITGGDWATMLGAARQLGWKPAGTIEPWPMEEGGTKPPPRPDWNGSYEANEGQLVTREDALALADALGDPNVATLIVLVHGGPMGPEYWQSQVERLIEYCRAGSFRID